MPASACGMFGLKPSRGRNPIGPDFSWESEGLSTSGVITRTVRDSAAMLDATEGAEPGSPYVAPGPTGFLAALSQERVFGSDRIEIPVDFTHIFNQDDEAFFKTSEMKELDQQLGDLDGCKLSFYL